MAVGYNPRTVTDGLVLALDAGNPKNYNAGISTNWTDKVGGNNGTLVGGTYHNDGPFVGAGYVDLNSSGDYLSIADSADLELDTNTTIELFIKFNTIPTVATYIFGKTNGYWLAYDSTTVGGVADRFTFAIYNGSSWSGATNASGGFLPVVNTWYHIAVVKEGTSTKLYVDGTLYGSGTFSGTPADNSNVVSINYSGGTIDADISNVRFIRGTALYTSNFTPPTKPLTAVTNTTLLTCQGNTIADASSSAHTITANGDISLTKEPFAGAGAVYFDGTGDYLSVADGTDFTLGTDNFTLECWVYFQSDSLQMILGQNDGNLPTSSIDIRYSSGTITAYAFSGSSDFSRSGSAAQNSWHHIAWVRDGSAMRLFINGTQTAGTSNISTNSINDSSEQFGVGAGNGSGGYKMTGYLSNVRLIKGTALYTSNFTPPSRTLEPIENTVLLTCQGQNIKDASSSAHAITVNGDAKATIVSSAFEFDGTGDYVQMDSSTDTDLSGDFTIEAWVYPTANGESSNSEIVSRGAASTLNGWHFAVANGTTRLFFGVNYAGTGAADYTLTSGSMTLNSWNHVAVTRSGDTVRIFIDGSLDVTNSSATGRPTVSGTEYVYVGRGSYDLGNREFNGKISGVKIYKGKGLTAAEVTQNYNATKGRYA